MKILYPFFLFIALSLSAVAQDYKVNYEYDAAGNRISRKVIPVTLISPQNSKHFTEESAPVEAELGEQTITIFPNPTRGHLAIEITGNETQDISITLYNANGVQLQNIQYTGDRTKVDMTQYPSTWYILRVFDGKINQDFKIIKQ